MRVTRRLCRYLLKILNVRCTFESPHGYRFTGAESYLLLPNHISYLDAVIAFAFMPSVFVTSRDMEATPGLGHMARAAGCAFVERFHRRDILKDINRIAETLNQGLSVTLFPEGTTSKGDRIAEFKKSLLEAAVISRCRVLPVVIRYEAVDGRPYGEANRDAVAWYGDMKFLPHLVSLAATTAVDVRLTVLPAVLFRGHGCRKRLADDVKTRISERFHADF